MTSSAWKQFELFRVRRFGARLMAILITSIPVVAMADTFPRIGHMWVSVKTDFLQTDSLRELAVADFVVVNPNQGTQMELYIDQINRARESNPELMVIRYFNVTELNEAWNVTADAWVVLDEVFVNPNRGGTNKANDGLARDAEGGLPNSWSDNNPVNILG